MSEYHIYQTNADYKFLSWNLAKNKFSIDDYHKVYSGILIDSITYGDEINICNNNDDKVLEDLYEIFNINHPEDFKARSLSVSDVVEISRKNTAKYYYCDSMGWKLIWSENRKEN